jgi:copper chaperone CopZ
MKGVSKVDASYITGWATITFDESIITVEEIIEGYNRSQYPVVGKPQWIK